MSVDPPETPAIPEGLATKIGKILTAVLAVLAACAQAGIDFDPQTQKFILLAVLVGGAIMGGRYWQAAMKYRNGLGGNVLGVARLDPPLAPTTRERLTSPPASDPPPPPPPPQRTTGGDDARKPTKKAAPRKKTAAKKKSPR